MMSLIQHIMGFFFHSGEAITCTAEEVLQKIETGQAPLLIDVREASELRDTGFIPNAVHIPLGQLSARISEFENTSELICYCRSGQRSRMAAKQFRRQNISALSMNGGIRYWQKISGPTETWG